MRVNGTGMKEKTERDAEIHFFVHIADHTNNAHHFPEWKSVSTQQLHTIRCVHTSTYIYVYCIYTYAYKIERNRRECRKDRTEK